MKKLKIKNDWNSVDNCLPDFYKPIKVKGNGLIANAHYSNKYLKYRDYFCVYTSEITHSQVTHWKYK